MIYWIATVFLLLYSSFVHTRDIIIKPRYKGAVQSKVKFCKQVSKQLEAFDTMNIHEQEKNQKIRQDLQDQYDTFCKTKL